MRWGAAWLAALALALAPAACGDSGGAETPAAVTAPRPQSAAPIVIGTKDFTEQFILGELYRQALEAKGFDVVLKPDIGPSELTHRALVAGSLDMYPEYVGVLLSEVAKQHRRQRSPAAAYELAKDYEESQGFTLLRPTPFSDSNALAVKPAFARRHDLRRISDLRRLAGRVRIGALSEFRIRFDGLVGLERIYGLRNLTAVRLVGAGRYRALESGRVDVASVFTTEGQLAGGDYLVLKDPRRVFAAQHVAPIIDRDVLRRHGTRLRRAIDAVSRTLTTPRMQRMNAAVDLDGRKPRDVAAAFLRARGLT